MNKSTRTLATRTDADLRVSLAIDEHEAAHLVDPALRAAAASMVVKIRAEMAFRAGQVQS